MLSLTICSMTTTTSRRRHLYGFAAVMVLLFTTFAASALRAPSTSIRRRSLALSSSKTETSSVNTFWRSNQAKDCWRPDVRDVERISFGQPAKKKGTGSRGIPHRLNEDERRSFDQARRQGAALPLDGGDGSVASWRWHRRTAGGDFLFYYAKN